MKKVFSLLLVVAMLVSMAVVASAAEPNAAGGMHAVVTETADDITVDVYVTNIDYCAGFNFIMTTDALTYVDGSAVLGDVFAAGKLTPSTKAGQIKFVHSFTDLSQYPTEEGTVLALTFKVEKTTDLTEENIFTYGTKSTTASKVTTGTGGTVAGQAAGNNFTSAKVPAYFTKAYVDAREPIVEEPDFTAEAAGTTITCMGKVDATVSNYGVVFTADSTVDGVREQKYYGAMPADVIAAGNTEFTLDSWDGTFVIVLEGVHAGSKTLSFFANDTVIEGDTTFTVVAE